jgi:hypothetical protein
MIELVLAGGRIIYALELPPFIGELELIVWEGRVFRPEHVEHDHPSTWDRAQRPPRYREEFAWFAPRAQEKETT